MPRKSPSNIEPYGIGSYMFGNIILSCVMFGKILSVTEGLCGLQEQRSCRP